MKRLICVVAAAAFLVALVGVHDADAGPKKHKIHICHVPGGQTIGHVIEVAMNAVDAHCKHGDNNHWRVVTKDGGCIPCHRLAAKNFCKLKPICRKKPPK